MKRIAAVSLWVSVIALSGLALAQPKAPPPKASAKPADPPPEAPADPPAEPPAPAAKAPVSDGLLKRAPASCRNAYAVLGWSGWDDKRRKEPWKTLGYIMHSKSFWHIVQDVKPGVAQQAAFYHYKVHGHENGNAYVAHCGSGSTCNAIAASFFRAYKHIGKPMVYCGMAPNILHSPERPEVYKPNERELMRWNEANIGAILFGGDSGPSADELADQF